MLKTINTMTTVAVISVVLSGTAFADSFGLQRARNFKYEIDSIKANIDIIKEEIERPVIVDPVTSCSDIHVRRDCVWADGCRWDERAWRCVNDIDHVIPLEDCDSIRSFRECSNTSGCIWDFRNSRCISGYWEHHVPGDRAHNLFDKASDLINEAAIAIDQSVDAYMNGNTDQGDYFLDQACSKLSSARLKLAHANRVAASSCYTGTMSPFELDITNAIADIVDAQADAGCCD